MNYFNDDDLALLQSLLLFEKVQKTQTKIIQWEYKRRRCKNNDNDFITVVMPYNDLLIRAVVIDLFRRVRDEFFPYRSFRMLSNVSGYYNYVCATMEREKNKDNGFCESYKKNGCLNDELNICTPFAFWNEDDFMEYYGTFLNDNTKDKTK